MNYLLIIITILFLCLLTYFTVNHKEPFITYVKDRQLIGTFGKDGLEDDKYPLGSMRNDNKNGRNDEQCYGTLNVPSKQIIKDDNGLCINKGSVAKRENNKKYKIVDGERIPSSAMYAIDFSNYETYYEKRINGIPLTGTITAGNMVFSLSNEGRPINKRMTLSKVKSICDELGSSCAGFTVFSPTADNPEYNDTLFYASINQDSRDIYSLDYEFSNVGKIQESSQAKYLKINPGAVSYIKKNPEYVEKPVVKLNLGTANFTKKNCTVKQNDFVVLSDIDGTLDQCKTRCMTFSNPDCVGFVKNIKVAGEEGSSKCVFHRGINYDETVAKSDCPTGFDKKTSKDNFCVKSRDTNLTDVQLRQNCVAFKGIATPRQGNGNIESCQPDSNNVEKICLPSDDFAVYKREYDK